MDGESQAVLGSVLAGGLHEHREAGQAGGLTRRDRRAALLTSHGVPCHWDGDRLLAWADERAEWVAMPIGLAGVLAFLGY